MYKGSFGSFEKVRPGWWPHFSENQGLGSTKGGYGCHDKNVIFLIIISTGRLEATASAGGDIGLSSQLDHSKALDLTFSDLYWSSFLDYVQKNRYRNKTDLYF